MKTLKNLRIEKTIRQILENYSIWQMITCCSLNQNSNRKCIQSSFFTNFQIPDPQGKIVPKIMKIYCFEAKNRLLWAFKCLVRSVIDIKGRKWLEAISRHPLSLTDLTEKPHSAPDLWDMSADFCNKLTILNWTWLLLLKSNYPLNGYMITKKIQHIH